MKKIIGILFLLLSFTAFAGADKAPNFTAKDQYGIEQSIENYKGKFVLLTFWATWCPACRHELPVLDELYKKYGENKKDIVFLGVNNEKMDTVKEFLENKGYKFPTVVSEEAFQKYPVRAFPTLFVIDRDGNVINYAMGAIPGDTLERYINASLLEKSF